MTYQAIKRVIIWPIIGLVIVVAGVYGAGLTTPSPEFAVSQTSAVSNGVFTYKSTSTASSTALWKLTCDKLKSNITKAIDDYNKAQKLEWKEGGATYGLGNYINLKKFSKILYSPGLGECIAIVIDQTLLQKGKEMTIYEKSYGFYGATTYDYIDWIDVVKHGRPYYSMADVAQKVHEYETETSSPVDLTNP